MIDRKKKWRWKRKIDDRIERGARSATEKECRRNKKVNNKNDEKQWRASLVFFSLALSLSFSFSFLYLFVQAQRRGQLDTRWSRIYVAFSSDNTVCAVAAAVVYFFKSSMKTATLLRLTSIDSKCNIFVCSGISIHFLLARSLWCAFFGTFLHSLSFTSYFLFAFLRFLFLFHRIALIFFHRFRSLHP